MDEERARRILARYYRWLRRYGLNDSHSGNASLRLGDELLITPTGACADTLRPEALVRGPLDAPRPEGASRDWALHQAVYRRHPRAMAVLHSHCPHAVALTLAGGDFAPVDLEGELYFPRVPAVDVDGLRYVETAPEPLARALDAHGIAIIRGHGVYAMGENLDEAYKLTCSLEQSATIAWLARMGGTTP
jgi:L-fuculose-phosphate aldolase